MSALQTRQLDLMRGQINRRDARILELRTEFLKEIVHLKEQLFAKSRFGDAYLPEDFGLPSVLKEDAGDELSDEERIPKKTFDELVEKMSQKFAEERKKIESQLRVSCVLFHFSCIHSLIILYTYMSYSLLFFS